MSVLTHLLTLQRYLPLVLLVAGLLAPRLFGDCVPTSDVLCGG